jgi:hypothetical protein
MSECKYAEEMLICSHIIEMLSGIAMLIYVIPILIFSRSSKLHNAANFQIHPPASEASREVANFN